ncbi:MAG: PEP-CTERM sorting domain-containing protein, partial [Sphingomonadaceae bacterium]
LHTLGRLETVRGVEGAFVSEVVPADATSFPFLLTFELDPGTSFYDWNWRFAANAFMAPGAQGFAYADYGSTFLIRSVGFRDSLGRDITGRLGVTFQSGASYPLSAIPEPGPWALLVSGFGLVGIVLRRRGVDRNRVLA